jgi:2-amino-4-hydroxy-6-hydroxymethyldihydropteridine diphosphokinase
MGLSTQRAFISAGSNLGDRKANLKFALNALAVGNTLRSTSSFFETEPVGYLNQPWFLNLAIEFETAFLPSELLAFCQKIEKSCGRVRTFPNAPRTLDLDILLFGDIVMNMEELIIPHPRLADRRFVLEPLAQIAPEVMHPILKKTIKELLDSCQDPSEIRILDES